MWFRPSLYDAHTKIFSNPTNQFVCKQFTVSLQTISSYQSVNSQDDQGCQFDDVLVQPHNIASCLIAISRFPELYYTTVPCKVVMIPGLGPYEPPCRHAFLCSWKFNLFWSRYEHTNHEVAFIISTVIAVNRLRSWSHHKTNADTKRVAAHCVASCQSSVRKSKPQQV